VTRPASAFTVIFDGDCRVCTRMVEVLRRLDRDGMLEIIPSQTPGVRERFPWIAPHAYEEAMQLVAPDGTTWQGADAVEMILGVLPRGRFVSWIYRIPLVRPLADRLYKWVARNRHRLGCGTHCRSRFEI
jgi:predicted DCC family thiol-disulfide oxidoreductase YuxK